jgi:hypothetical protein
LGAQLNVLDIKESRQYSALSFAAFKNFDKCFAVIMNHAKEFNLPKEVPNFAR